MNYTQSAEWYDPFYDWKDYAAEAVRVHALIEEHKRSSGTALLDVACGTGKHLAHLKEHYQTTGLDISEEMLTIARRRCPDLTFYQGDMRMFSLDERFDVVTCFFGSIGYMCTITGLTEAVDNMARHLKPGGLLVIQAWVYAKQFINGHTHLTSVEHKGVKIARVARAERLNESMAAFEFHFLAASAEGVDYLVERHEMGLYDHEDYIAALETAGLTLAYYDEMGLEGRGLYLARSVR